MAKSLDARSVFELLMVVLIAVGPWALGWLTWSQEAHNQDRNAASGSNPAAVQALKPPAP